MYDLIIRNGTVIDGTGADRVIADIAIQDGKIAKVGKISESAKKEMDATGKLVTPGWVDIHTHYD
jgi:N-acyl-D-amino-acid deacylase